MSFRKIADFNNLFITGDLHLSYTLNRSIKNRGFDNAIEHTKVIRNNINSVCKSPSDILIINGDFCNDMNLARVFLKDLTPKNIWLTIGNHDKIKDLMSLRANSIISRIEHEIKINWRGELFHVQHLPLLEFDGLYRNSYHWYAHTHNTCPPYLRAMDCGLDCFDLKPVDLYKIVELRSQYSNIDEYGKRIKMY